jgi:hypothetical protein
MLGYWRWRLWQALTIKRLAVAGGRVRVRVSIALVASCLCLPAGAWATADGESGPSAYAADVVRSCPGNHRLPNTPVWYGDLSVRNMTCRRGRQSLHGARLTNSGHVGVAGWSCRLIGHYYDGGIFRCTRARRAMRFSAGG